MPSMPCMPYQVGRNLGSFSEDLRTKTVGRILRKLSTKVRVQVRRVALSCRIFSTLKVFPKQRRDQAKIRQLLEASGTMAKLLTAITVLVCTGTSAFKTGYDRRTGTNHWGTLLHASNEPISTQGSLLLPSNSVTLTLRQCIIVICIPILSMQNHR